MRPSHLVWTLLAIFSICEASQKLHTSSSHSLSHVPPRPTPRHSSEIKKHSPDPPHHTTSLSSSLKKSKSSPKSKDLPPTSTRTKSTSKASTTSKVVIKTTKRPSIVDHDIKSSSSVKSMASHKSTISPAALGHKSSSSTKSISKTENSPTPGSKVHVIVSSSTISLSSSEGPKAALSPNVHPMSSTSSSEKTTLQRTSALQQPSLSIISSKQVASLGPSQIWTTSIVPDGHAIVAPKNNASRASTRSGITSSMTLQKANTTQPLKSSPMASSTSRNSISPSGLALQTVSTNKTGPCSDGTFIDASCFSRLNLAEYLVQWWNNNEGECESKNAQFARCFYALETPYGPSDCAQMNNDAACTQPLWNDFKNAKNGIQNFYVAWNLWNTNGFFLDLWTAMGAAESSSQAGIGSIISLLDPPSDKTKMEYVLDALSFGLSLYAEGSIFMKALLRSAPQGYGLGNKIFQRGTVDGEYQDWSVISANLGRCTDIFRATVADELPLIQNNLTTFIQWSEISGLSGYRAPLNGLAQNMTQALNTYAIARILDTQGIVISRAANTDVHALQTNGSQLNWDTGCGGGYDSFGICDTFYWDGKDTYGLTDPLHFTKSYHDELEELFTPKDNAPSLTTGRLLFSGAQHCYEATGKNGGSPPLLDPNDASHIVCLSNAPICTWDETAYGPFDNSCKNQPDRSAPLWGFGAAGCKGEDNSIFSIDVPRAYLGPGIYQDAKNIDALSADSFCDDVDF